MGGELVLVSGITGYVAAHVARELLSKGYRVRGTLRTVSKGDHLRGVLPNVQNLEFVEVRDLVDDGAFDEAVRGVDYIIHTASPFHYKVEDPERDLINPAVRGTTGIIRSAIAHAGPQLKRMVVTSSMAAVRTPTPRSADGLTEDDWNDAAVAALREGGAGTFPPFVYAASKSLAERAAWDVVRGQEQFDLVTINPPFVYGPPIHMSPTLEDLNTSVKIIADFLYDETKQPGPNASGHVDVRDVATAHVRALTAPGASNKRIIVSAGTCTQQEIIEILRRTYPGRRITEGNPGLRVQGVREINTRSREVLGMEYIGLEKSVVDTAEELIARFH